MESSNGTEVTPKADKVRPMMDANGWIRGYGNLLTLSDADMVNAEADYWAEVNDEYDRCEGADE